jgi:hypothetical protein
MQGDTVKAKAAYQDFLTFWKDADPDIPVLKEWLAAPGCGVLLWPESSSNRL